MIVSIRLSEILRLLHLETMAESCTSRKSKWNAITTTTYKPVWLKLIKNTPNLVNYNVAHKHTMCQNMNRTFLPVIFLKRSCYLRDGSHLLTTYDFKQNTAFQVAKKLTNYTHVDIIKARIYMLGSTKLFLLMIRRHSTPSAESHSPSNLNMRHTNFLV